MAEFQTMNLLVTNTRHSQAYAIIRALRPHAQKIVVSMYGRNYLAARLSHAANSRLVDRRYRVPSPVEDWEQGKIQRENTEQEEKYIQAIERICEKEEITTIFPSYDPHVYVFSKNKERFAKMGILIPIPDYETVITPLDKYRTACAAQEVGFPCPKTYLPESDDELRRIAGEVGLPLVIRPRFSSGAEGMQIVNDVGSLAERFRFVETHYGPAIVQEYIPGSRTQTQCSYRVVLTKDGELVAGFSTRILRAFFRLRRNWVVAHEFVIPGPYLMDAVKLLNRIGWWGGATVSTKVDPRDGLPKLTEINCRLGSRLWHVTELGFNVPLVCLKIARGEKVDWSENYPCGTLVVDPMEDGLQLGLWTLDFLLYKLRIGVLKRTPVDPLKAPMAPGAILQSYRSTYLTKSPRVFSPYFRHCLQDPVVSILRWLSLSKPILRHINELGK
ncbi:MAG: hypothetical protein WCH75_10045 [Candidatus Binatia bacterium]